MVQCSCFDGLSVNLTVHWSIGRKFDLPVKENKKHRWGVSVCCKQFKHGGR